MIDWVNVFYHTLWVVGLALILAAFSYQDWQAWRTAQPLRQRLAGSAFQLATAIGLLLVSLSLIALAGNAWERVIWLVFALLFTWQGWQAYRTLGSN